jgi:hypothetical protein
MIQWLLTESSFERSLLALFFFIENVVSVEIHWGV